MLKILSLESNSGSAGRKQGPLPGRTGLIKPKQEFKMEMPPGQGGISYFKGRPVSRVLSLCGVLPEDSASVPSFISTRSCLQAHTTYPPARASSPRMPVYMVFQPIRCTARCVTTATGELLPHLFTNSPPGGVAVVFCYTAIPLRISSR